MADNLISIEEGRPNNIEDDTARLLPDSDNQKKSTNSNTKRLVTSIIISIYIVWACIVLFVIRSGISEEAVASEEIHCSQIGVDVLKEGGSAMDATIATQLCIGTINAFSSGIGGGGFLLVRDSNGTLETLDFREVAPLASYKTMFVKNPELAKFGGLSVGVPGEVLGMEIAHKRYGKLPWKRLFEPSIKLSREGFKVPSELANRLSYSAIYAPNGKLLGEGDLLIRKNYSDTLESIANNGSYVFYNVNTCTGYIAESLVNFIGESGGIMTLEDFQIFQPITREPVIGYYNALIAMLNILERYQLIKDGMNDINLHRIIEAMKFGFALRTEMGDPLFINNTERVLEIMTKNYSGKLRQNISDPLYYNPIYDVVEDHGTTHISAIDKNNQSVSYTSTVNLVWGSRVMDPSTGIILNDEMDDFSIPGVTNYFGLKPSPFNFVEPKKKPLSSCLPVIIETDGQVETILGGSGGSRIISSVLLYILNIYDFDMNVLEAINQPRVHHQLVPNLVSVEADFSRLLLDQLILKGHNITMDEPFGYSQVQAIRKFKNGVIHAASDYRKNGVAAGY
ncbi:15549_t:CDS:10 [Entrophospora sp. SA101]|nr:15549_t:CDS:10 [Entrophospora sp. SA101]CAJ0830661.1 14340_t:CDS:10 [Entrophospora sp. SA101]